MGRTVMSRAGLRQLEARLENLTHTVAEDVADDACRFCPIDTGRLRSSIEARGNRVRVSAPYWADVEYGTRPHPIVAHGRYSLHNVETGEYFGPRVWHPGTPAQPFMRPALMRARPLR